MESRCDDGADDDADKSDLQLVREERMPVFSQHGTHVDQKYGPGDSADDGQDREFRPYTLSPAVTLKAGDNTVTIQILDSVATAGIGTATAQGPMVDYLQIDEANGEIGWRPRVANTK